MENRINWFPYCQRRGNTDHSSGRCATSQPAPAQHGQGADPPAQDQEEDVGALQLGGGDLEATLEP